jgi:CHRD domain
MRHLIFSVAICALIASALPVQADPFSTTLSGFQEIGALNAATGAILTNGQGSLQLDLDESNGMLTYTLTYSDLTTNVTQAHIHFGKLHVAGGIFVFLCSNLGNGPAGTPACPAAGGTVSGTITAASVLAVPGQNVTAGDFDAVVQIITSDTAYANIHTVKFPAGEIRGQITHGNGH